MSKKKDNKDSQLIMDELTEESKMIVEEFLKHYKNSKQSYIVYRNSVANLIYETEKVNFRKLNVVDYKNINIKDSQRKHKQTFFKYLYAYDYMNNESGFKEEWGSKEKSKEYFLKRIEGKTFEREVMHKHLTIQQIWNIQQLLEISTQNIDDLKMKFCWYMLFETDCTVTSIKNIKSNNFNDDQLNLKNGKKYSLPNEFKILFDKLHNQIYDGFSGLNTYIQRLGSIVEIDNLVPQNIRATRKNNMIHCCNCQKKYVNTSTNWVSVNGTMICIYCYEELKKNFKIKSNKFIDYRIAINTNDDKIKRQSTISTFDQLKEGIPPKIDYLKLHEFQIIIGKLGEAFVFEWEKQKLESTEYYSKIDNTKALNPKNGYDILSFDENGCKIFIEVKTSIKEDNAFYLTENEIKTAEEANKNNNKYYIYRVTNILSQNKEDINLKIIKNLFNNDYEISPYNWIAKMKAL